MARRNKPTTNGTATAAAPAANHGAEEQSAPPLPEVEHIPEPIRCLSYPQRLALVTELLNRPRKFLVAACGGDCADPTALPKASLHAHAYNELRRVIEAYLPDWHGSVSGRRLHRAFLLQSLGELPADELDQRVTRLVARLLPYDQESREARLHEHRELLQDVIADIDAEISRCLTEGQRHEAILCTRDLPQEALRCVHSDSDLYWDLARPLHLASIRYDLLPEGSPLKRLDPQRLPGLSRTGGPFVVLLGPANLGTIAPIPRGWYYLATAAVFTMRGFQEWAQRHRNFLDANRETPEQFQRFLAFEDLRKVSQPPLWSYPDPPAAPDLDGFATRTLFAIDLVGRLARYLTKPPGRLPLDDLLAARRVLVDPTADQAADTASLAARMWVAKWCSHNCRDDLYDCLGSIASTTLKAIEELEEAFHDHSLAQFQSQHILQKG